MTETHGRTGHPTRQSRPSVTIKDVAAAAGVSTSTVSHTFSGRRAISETTRQRVLAAAEELGYVPNAHARKLRLGRSNMLGLVLRPRFAVTGAPDTSETFNRLSGAMATASLRRGLGLVHVPDVTGSGHDLPPMDGCIVAHPYENDETIRVLEQARIPFVLADPDPARDDIPWVVGVDYATGVRAVLDLAAGGVAGSTAGRSGRHVVLMPGTEHNAWNLVAEATYRTWCAGAGQEPDIHHLREGAPSDDVRSTVRTVLEGIAHAGEPISLIFSDSSATPAVLAELGHLGLQVPVDVALATLTDSVHTRVAVPPVTGMDLSHEQLAEAAVEMLVSRLSGDPSPQLPRQVSPVVNERESTRGF
ncbi:LacI family DNA-binding transcriptional regulator [Corynebacterium variabile]|uniref:LacI family DNA-binding transcriptional regulator n=1 Tax=Corynebacterium variabile TaxID=1727 RepID=UPI003FD57F5C